MSTPSTLSAHTCPVGRAILGLFNLQGVPLRMCPHQQQTFISTNHSDRAMGVNDFRRTQGLRSLFNKAKRAFTNFLEMSYGFAKRRKTAARLRLIGSIKPDAAIRRTSENAIIALRFFEVTRFPFASYQAEHDFLCYGYVFRAL